MGILSDQKSPSLIITGLDKKPLTITPDQLKDMDHSSLSLLREYNLDNKDAQTMIAPYEHQAFAREATTENLGMAIPIALATPLYAAAKSVGFMTDPTTTTPSLQQVGRGLLGVGQGIYQNIANKLN